MQSFVASCVLVTFVVSAGCTAHVTPTEINSGQKVDTDVTGSCLVLPLPKIKVTTDFPADKHSSVGYHSCTRQSDSACEFFPHYTATYFI